MKKKKRKPIKDINELTKGYEKFIEGKELREDGKETFEEVIRKAGKGNKKKSGN